MSEHVDMTRHEARISHLDPKMKRKYVLFDKHNKNMSFPSNCVFRLRINADHCSNHPPNLDGQCINFCWHTLPCHGPVVGILIAVALLEINLLKSMVIVIRISYSFMKADFKWDDSIDVSTERAIRVLCWPMKPKCRHCYMFTTFW